MRKIHKKHLLTATLLCATSLFIASISSCSFFENDVNDFMEKYTETAGVLEHHLSIETYKDNNNLDCVNSKMGFTTTMYMRNPKQFSLVPSVTFPNLDPNIPRDGVIIQQVSFDELTMTIPFEFLQVSDEGRNISPEIYLYEPMSGRTFEPYTFQLSCNSVPPQLLNPTIINDGGQTFALAFDMPSAEELSLRHKDLATITINQVAYPVTVNEDGTFAFEDPHFSIQPKSSYIFLSGKPFKHSNRSVYFETGDPFTEGDKEYELIIKDHAGLSSSSYASTIITRLMPPSVIDFDDFELEDGCNDIVPGNSEDRYKLTIKPSVSDHKGNEVQGTTTHYALYKGTSTIAELYPDDGEGSTETEKQFLLEEGTYYLEVYATKDNYEQSATATFNLRVVDNSIYVSENGNDSTGDGTKDLQFASIQNAIKDLEKRGLNGADFYIYITGTIRENVNISTTVAKSITLAKYARAESAVIDGQGSGSTLTLNTVMPVTLKNITITGGRGANGGAVNMVAGSTLTLKTGTVLTGNSASENGGAIYAPATSNLIISDGVSITKNQAGSNGGGVYTEGSISMSGAITITENTAGTANRPSNLCLGTNTLIDITGALVRDSTESKIGISTMKVPTVLTPVPITRHYGYLNGINKNVIPGKYFIGDSHAITYDETTGEALIAINNGDFEDVITAQSITFTISRTWFNAESNTAADRTFTITPKVMGQGPEGLIDITEDALADTEHPIEWDIQLYIGGIALEGAHFDSLTFTIPQNITYVDVYTLQVQAHYNGMTYDDEFTITGWEE